MEKGVELPFKVGQHAELKSFEEGYRGAWFRIKIREISKRNGRLGHVSEYEFFPEEEVVWTPLYDVNPYTEGKKKEKQRELMLRPPYPPIYNEKQMPHVSEITEVTVIGGDSWRVGDLVDWWASDCYWSGKITELFGNNEAQIELTPKPLGEGLSDKASLTDLRPSLDWSLELGWTIPSQEDGSSRPCARLVKPINQVVERTISAGNSHQANHDSEARPLAKSILSGPASSSSAEHATKRKIATKTKTPSLRETVTKKHTEKEARGLVDTKTRKTSLLSSECEQKKAAPAATKIAEEVPNLNSSWNKCTGVEGLVLRSTHSSLPESVLGLEECLNKVKWLKKLMQYGISSSDAEGPQWEFMA